MDVKESLFIRVRRLHQGKLNATSFVDFDKYDGSYHKENKAVEQVCLFLLALYVCPITAYYSNFLIWLKKGMPVYLCFQTETQRKAGEQPK